MSLSESGATTSKPTRNPSILMALDSVHRSLLMNNLQYEGEKQNEPQDADRKAAPIIDENSQFEDSLFQIDTPRQHLKSETISTIDCNRNDGNTTTISSYNESKFLRAALGDENQTTTDTFRNDDYEEDNYDVVDTSLQLSNSPPPQDTTISSNFKYPNSSFSTSTSTSSHRKLNSSIEVYRGLKEKLRSSFRRGKKYIRKEVSKISENRMTSPSTPNTTTQFSSDELEKYKANYSDKIAEKLYYTYSSKMGSKVELSDQQLLELINQITYQKTIREQLSNAVSICRNTREFESSPELIEAERLLLLSSLKETAAKQELMRIDNEQSGCIVSMHKRRGTVTINRIECRLKDIIVKDTVFNYFYVCMCSYKEKVISTRVIERNGDRLLFYGELVRFYDLEPEYEIKIEVFALRLRKNVRTYSHESKFHLNKETKKYFPTCPSPSSLSPGKLFQSSTQSSTLPKKFLFDAEFSRFKSQGVVQVTSFSLVALPEYMSKSVNESPSAKRVLKKCDNLYIFTVDDIKLFKVTNVSYNSNIEGDIMVGVKTEVSMENKIVEGFLNVGENLHGLTNWNRRWCHLDGLLMHFYNYPTDHENEKALFKIDLCQSIQDRVEMADRSICPKPRTFTLQIFKQSECNATDRNVKIYFFSADNVDDLRLWMNELGTKIKFLREWKL